MVSVLQKRDMVFDNSLLFYLPMLSWGEVLKMEGGIYQAFQGHNVKITTRWGKT